MGVTVLNFIASAAIFVVGLVSFLDHLQGELQRKLVERGQSHRRLTALMAPAGASTGTTTTAAAAASRDAPEHAHAPAAAAASGLPRRRGRG